MVFSESVRHVSFVPWLRNQVYILQCWRWSLSVRKHVILHNRNCAKLWNDFTTNLLRFFSVPFITCFQNHVLIPIFSRNLVMFRKYLHKRMVRLRVLTSTTSQLALLYLIQHLLDFVYLLIRWDNYESLDNISRFCSNVKLIQRTYYNTARVLSFVFWAERPQKGLGKNHEKQVARSSNGMRLTSFFKQIGQKN